MRPVNAIAILNQSPLDDSTVALFVEAYRAEIPAFCETWGIPAFGIAVYPSRHEGAPEEEAALILVDSAGDPRTFGAHSALGLSRWGYVDVASSRARGEPVDRVFGHELFELPVDPDLDRWTTPIDGVRYAIEVADSPQRFSRPRRASFLGTSGDVEIACFVKPNFFDPTNRSGDYDSQGVITRPLEIAAGGYLMTSSNGAVVIGGSGETRVTSHGRTARRLATGAP